MQKNAARKIGQVNTCISHCMKKKEPYKNFIVYLNVGMRQFDLFRKIVSCLLLREPGIEQTFRHVL